MKGPDTTFSRVETNKLAERKITVAYYYCLYQQKQGNNCPIIGGRLDKLYIFNVTIFDY